MCLLCSAARSLTRPLASYPGTEHIRTGVLGFTCRHTHTHTDTHGVSPRKMGKYCRGAGGSRAAVVQLLYEVYLVVHNVGQVQRLLDDGHEGLPQHLGDKDVRHGEQAVGTEGLDQQQLVDRLANGSWAESSREGKLEM